MATNRYESHLLVYSEDRSYDDIFKGVRLHMNFDNRRVQSRGYLSGYDDIEDILTNSGGSLVKHLKKYENSHVLVLIDLDRDSSVFDKVNDLSNKLSSDYKNRVFVLSSLYEAEHAKKATLGQGTWEDMGCRLARSCQDDECDAWKNDMLKHNLDEIERVKSALPWLFEEADDF